MARYKYFITRSAERDLNKIDAVERKRIGHKLRYFVSVEDPVVFAVQLSGIRPPIYRFRVGKYRVFFDIKHNTLRILSITLRDKAYRQQ